MLDSSLGGCALFLPASPGVISTSRRCGNLSRLDEQVYSSSAGSARDICRGAVSTVLCNNEILPNGGSFTRIAPRLPDAVCQPRLSKETAGAHLLWYSQRQMAAFGAVRCDADWCLSFLGLIDLRRSLGSGAVALVTYERSLLMTTCHLNR
jgi:hypothetical protein